MSPIEIYIDKRLVAKTDSGPADICLPTPPGGRVKWTGDRLGKGQMIAGPNNQMEVFEFTEPGQEASYKIAKDLSAALFSNAENTKVEVKIRRVESK